MTMLVYMVGRNIPLYGIDIDAYSNVNVDAQSILLQAISGDMKNCSIFIIGLWPYMLASMLAILIVAIMSLDNTRKLSPKKINIWTVTIMMIIAAVQAYHKTQTLMYRVSGDELIWNKIIVFIQLIAGMLIVVYMCDRATRYGIGGKVSVFMVNIVICLLTIIFSMVMLSPGRTADDLLKSGDSIQDIYAGKSTKRYLIGTVLSFSVISSIIICICQGGPLFLQFGGYVDASLAMLPCSIMMTTGLWISLYREAEVYRNMDRYHTFI